MGISKHKEGADGVMSADGGIDVGEKIKLFVRDGTNSVHIWTCDDWTRARSNRVVGNFVGSLAALPRQDVCDGLPLSLMPQEATLLLEKGLAEVIDAAILAAEPADDLAEESRCFRSEILTRQVDLLRNLRKRQITDKIDDIVKGKKAKMKRSSDNQEEEEEEEEDPETFKNRVLQEELDKVQAPKTTNLSVQIFTGDPWIKESDLKSCKWEYPKTEEDRLRYAVYKDLWERGYHVTSGRKFGADYLAYPGDPVKFHAQFIVVCTDRRRRMKASEVITYGRLGQSVRKTFVLAYLTREGSPCYQSVQWMGF